MQRVILHVDLNSFFATAEQQANPALRGKCVGIIKAVGRSCLIATSIEAKRLGIKTGISLAEARKICPSIILVPADFDKYEDITYRFIGICKDYSPLCEVFSLDECFIDVSETEQFFGGAVNVALKIKDRICTEIGDWITCSIGISHNRLLAKLASSLIKHDGLFIIDKNIARDILDSCKLMDVLGIGWGLDRHLRLLGIDNFPRLRSCSLTFLKKHFGPFWSVHLYNLARGIDNSPVLPYFEIADAKSVGRTYTTHRNLYRKSDIERLIRNLCEEASAKARRMGMGGRYIGIALRGGPARHRYAQTFTGGGDSFYWHKTLKNYICDGKQLFDICLAICRNWKLDYVRFCGVTLGMLAKIDVLPTPLFPADQRRQELTLTIDLVNQRFGDYTIYPGQLLGMEIIRPEVTGYFGDRKYRLDFRAKNP